MGIMRIDDVSANTDFKDFKDQVSILHSAGFELMAGVNLFSKKSPDGALYPDMPLSSKSNDYLLDVDSVVFLKDVFDCGVLPSEIVSHGMVHLNHAKLSRGAQELSILASCSFLKTNRFIPPFNACNEDTFALAAKHRIEVIGNLHDREWMSLESHDYDPSKKYWYYHPWRLNAKQLSEKLAVTV